jgi:putative transposase
MSDVSESPKGYRFPKLVIGHAVYLYHRLPISYRDVQELLFKRGIDVSHETVRAWCVKFGPDLAEALRHRKPKRGRVWHLDEMRIVMDGVVHWLWRAFNEHGEVLDVLLQKTRCKQADKRCLQRLLDEQGIPEQVVTDGLRSYGAAIRETPELSCALHIRVSAAEHQNNLIEQSHRPTRDGERQPRGFWGLERAQAFLFTHAEVGNLFRYTRARTIARLRRRNWLCAFGLWGELSRSIP